jgi:hypothetical protein
MAIVLAYVWYEHAYDVREEMLCSIELASNTWFGLEVLRWYMHRWSNHYDRSL